MTRNTHDRGPDHFGTDFDTDSVLSASLPAPVSTASGQTVRQALLDMIANLAGKIEQLLPDNDANFTTTIGNWTHSAGMLVRDTTVKIGFSTVASLKFTAAAANDHIDLPITGTFKAGVPYVLVLIAQQSIAGTSQKMEFGLIGTDATSLTWGFVPVDGGLALTAVWVPTADRTGISARWTNVGGVGDLWIKAARLYQLPEPPVVTIGGFQFLPVYGDANFGILESAGLLQFPINATAMNLVLKSDKYGSSGFQAGGFGAGNDSFTYVWAEHNPADFADQGLDFEVGSDYVGLYISEKDAGTIQIYPDASGGYDIELKDRGAGVWKTVDAAGTYPTPLANLQHMLIGTADPTAGGGVAHPLPAMYLRDNSGTTEIWTATGAGATAWQKVTIP